MKGIEISDSLTENVLSNENLSKSLVDRYSEIVELNKNMINISDNLLKYTNQLKDFSIYVNENKMETQIDLDDKSLLDTYKDEIEKLQGKKVY